MQFQVSMDNKTLTAILITIIYLSFSILGVKLLGPHGSTYSKAAFNSLGFILVLVYLHYSGENISQIVYQGAHSKIIMLYGFMIPSLLLMLSYLTEYVLFASRILNISIFALDHFSGETVHWTLGLAIISSNLIICFIDECLFRGVLINLFSQKNSPKIAILIQSFFYGIYILINLVGCITGETNIIFSNSIIIFIQAFSFGLIYGVISYITGSIWPSFLASFTYKITISYIHMNYANGFDKGLIIRDNIYTMLFLISLPVIIYYLNRNISTNIC